MSEPLTPIEEFHRWLLEYRDGAAGGSAVADTIDKIENQLMCLLEPCLERRITLIIPPGDVVPIEDVKSITITNTPKVCWKMIPTEVGSDHHLTINGVFSGKIVEYRVISGPISFLAKYLTYGGWTEIGDYNDLTIAKQAVEDNLGVDSDQPNTTEKPHGQD